jgi:hypothetical protein
MRAGWLLLAAFAACAQKAAEPPGNEVLRYTINWPSGLSLGEAQLRSTQGRDRNWEFEFTIEAAIPGFKVSDRYTGSANAEHCALEIEKQYVHGRRSARERTTFQQDERYAVRETLDGGGKSDFPIAPCAKDLLAFVHHLRRELAQGRIVPGATIVFGAKYDLRLEYKGSQRIVANNEPLEADRMQTTVKGPATDITFDVFFAKDAARTPALVKVPLELGTFSMELVR